MKIQDIEEINNTLISDQQLARDFVETPIEIRSYILKYAYRPPQVFWILLAGKRREYHADSPAKSFIDACYMLCNVLYKSHKIHFHTEYLVPSRTTYVTYKVYPDDIFDEDPYDENGQRIREWLRAYNDTLYHIIEDTERDTGYIYRSWNLKGVPDLDIVYSSVYYTIYNTKYSTNIFRDEDQVSFPEITRGGLRNFEDKLNTIFKNPENITRWFNDPDWAKFSCDMNKIPEEVIDFILYDEQPNQELYIYNVEEFYQFMSRVDWDDELI